MNPAAADTCWHHSVFSLLLSAGAISRVSAGGGRSCDSWRWSPGGFLPPWSGTSPPILEFGRGRGEPQPPAAGPGYLPSSPSSPISHLFLPILSHLFRCATRFNTYPCQWLVHQIFVTLSDSYLKQAKASRPQHHSSKNIAHDGSFQYCTWLYPAVPGCT